MRRTIFFLIVAIFIVPLTTVAMPVTFNLQSYQPDSATPQATVPVIILHGRKSSKNFEKVNSLFSEKKYKEINDLARVEIARNPDSGLAYEILGTALYFSNAVDEALKALEQSVRLEPQQSGAFSKIGIVYLQKDNLPTSKEYLQKALMINPSDRLAHQYLGLIYEYERDTAKAIFHFQQGLIGTDSQYLGIAVNLGRMLNTQNKYNETLALLQPRVPISSSVSEAHLVLGTAFLQIGNFSAAQERFERVVVLNPDLQEASLGIAMSLRKSGNLEEALKVVKQLNDQKPNWLPGIIEQGEILLLLKSIDQAKEVFSKGIQLGGNPVVVQKRFAQFYIHNQELQKAADIYEELLSTDKADEQVYANLSEIYQSQNEIEKGLQVLEKAVEKHQNNPYLLFRLGSYLASTKNYTGAIPIFSQALQLAPSDPNILKALTLVKAKTGDNSGALQSAKSLYDLNHEDEGAAVLYASRLSASGKTKEGEAVYRRILQKHPNNLLARNNLANLLADKGNLTEAESVARPLLEKPGDENSTFLDTLGWILFRQKKYSEALTLLKSAQIGNQQNPLIQYHYGMALAATGSKEQARKELENAVQNGGNEDWVKKAKIKIKEL